MTPQEFVKAYREAFGENVTLPIAFGFSNKPITEPRQGLRCIIGAFHIVRKGRSITFEDDFISCGGGQMYLGKKPLAERIPHFVSNIEHYKQTPQMVADYVESMAITPTDCKYLNLQRIDTIDSWEGTEGIICLATPDILSGLCAWAFYDRNEPDTVTTQFASGCAAAFSFAVTENRKTDGYRCFLGMLDVSARPLVPSNELVFAIPACRLSTMLTTMKDTCLFNGEAWQRVRNRIVND